MRFQLLPAGLELTQACPLLLAANINQAIYERPDCRALIMDRNRNSDPKSTLRKSTVSNGSAWNDAVCDKDQNPDRPPEMVGKLHAKAVVFSPRSTIQNGPGQPRSLEIRRAGWRTEGGGFSRMPRALTCLTLLELWRI
ncbi:hypothetical protein V8E54_015254 [Elaphomyces granulatus]